MEIASRQAKVGRERAGRAALVLLVLLALLGAAPTARAQTGDEPPPVALSVGIGIGLALAPMAVGGGLAARASGPRTRRLSLEILTGGLALAPVVSHLIAGEGYRATVFGSVTFSAAVLAISLLETSDRILDDTKDPACVVLGGALATLLVASGSGLLDSLMAGERRASGRLEIAPVIGPSGLSGPGTLALALKGRM